MQGYFLSPKQEDPFLAPYPDAWRLESEGGGVMVLLKVYPFNQLAAHFGAKRFGSFLKGASFDRLFRMGIDHFYPQNKGELYSYIMDEKGELSSSDPEKTAYLLLYHYCMGNRERVKTILEKLEDQGNTLPFTEEVHQNIDRILPFLIVDNSTFSIEIALKCAALQEKNSSVQEGGASRKFQQASMEIFRWIVLQQKYIQYLNHIEGEGDEFLTPMQELFILRSLSQFMVHYFKTEFLKLEEHGKLSSIINYVGIDALAIHFGMMPRLVKRFGILEAKYVENSGLLTGFKLFFSEDFFEDTHLLEGGYLPKGKRGAEAKVSTLFREIVNNPLLVGAFSANSLTIKKGDRTIHELPVEAEKITPEHLKEDFLIYYALAKGEKPKWGIRKNDFKKKAALFQKNLPLLQGGFKKEIALYYQILLVTAQAGLSHYMPWQVSAQKMEEKIERPIGLAIFIPPEEQTRAEGKRIFREAAIKQSEAYVWKYGKDYAIGKIKEQGKEYAITTAKAYVLGPLSVVTNYTYLKEQVERFNKHRWKFKRALQLWSGAKKIHGLYQKVREVKQGEGKLELRPMVDMQQQALAGWEKLLNDAMVALLKDYFDWEWKEVKDKPAQEILDGYEDPLKEFYAREAAQAFSATLKEGKSEEAFLEAVKGFKKEIEKAILDAEEAIVSFAALPREKVNRPAIERLKNPSNPVHRKEIEFKEILSSFLKGRYHDLLKKSTLKEKDLPLLEQKLFCYLVLSTRCLQLFRVMEKGDLHQIAEELACQRNYTFEENVSAQIIKGHLAVEYGTKTQMRAVQATQVAAITTKQRVVERAQMGIGKSTRIIPESSYIGADGETLMMNIWPKTVLRQNVMIAAQMGREAFRQGVDGLSFTMGPHWTSAKLSSLYSVLKSSIAERGQINWSEEDTIAIELSFIEYALDLTGKLKKAGDYWPKLTALRDILRLIRFQGRANIDEFHMTTQVNKVTNRPQGVKKAVKKGDARWIARTALALISSNLGKKWVTIKDASPKSLPKETFEKEIAPGLATMMADDLELGVSPNHRKSVSEGLGRGDVLPEECEKVQNQEALYMVRGMITHLLPLALEEIPDENYGESSDPDCEYVKPSEGNKNTLEQAEFISPYETVLKTCLFYLYKRLKNHQLEKALSLLLLRGTCAEFADRKVH
ncbi:MAG: DUF3638 domain-containing protein [Chlamydiia bacterium]|nr:DUF3638 domain-containing protein [Chlamydiia bacterium]